MQPECFVVVPWVRDEEVKSFLSAWRIASVPSWLVLQQDKTRAGCGATKNTGVAEASRRGADVVVVLDGDCYPSQGGAQSLDELVDLHVEALKPQEVEMFSVVTDPPSRGTPYLGTTLRMPVAASMGFWSEIGDYCAVRQLAHASAPMQFDTRPVFGRYFPLCGMNLAFRPWEWPKWSDFIDVSRFDDIWMGWLWQREAYRRGCCFNLNGPVIRHARQSNVWKNLADESLHLEASDALWKKIARNGDGSYAALRALLPV